MKFFWVFVWYAPAVTLPYQGKPYHQPADVGAWGIYETEKECKQAIRQWPKFQTMKCVEVPYGSPL